MRKTWTAGKAKEAEKPVTVTGLLNAITDEFCDEYCKYPDVCMSEKKDEDEAEELLYEKYCAGCPLMRL